MAGYFGGSFWHISLAGFHGYETSGFQRKGKAKEKRRKSIISGSVNCMMIIVCSQ
jgi:hypothetical protein